MPKARKKCNKCGKSLPVSAEFFHRHVSYQDGFRSTCKQCYRDTNVKANTDDSIIQICTSCKKHLPATAKHFHRSKIGKYGLMTVCKKCQSKIQKKKNNPANTDESIKKKCISCGMIISATTDYFYREKAGLYGVRGECKDCRREYHRKHNCTKEHRDLEKKRIKNNPRLKLSRNISASIRNSIVCGKNGRHWESIVDFTLSQLIEHIEKQFSDGMSWKNYGKWHIDHKIPISAFNFDSPSYEDFKRCWSLKNLQPMWASENISKGNKLKKHFQPSLPLMIGGR